MLFHLQETDEARMRSWGEVRLRSVAKMDFETLDSFLRSKDEDCPKAMPLLVSDVAAFQHGIVVSICDT